MSIMREKPIICKDWFDVSTLTDTRNGKKLDILSSANAGKFFEDVNDRIRTSWSLSVLAVSRNDRVYPDTLWSWINPLSTHDASYFKLRTVVYFVRT